MTCTRFSNAIICGSQSSNYGRLHVGNKYIWVDFHEYCGPSFSCDANGTAIYEPHGETDPVWPEFIKWLNKRDILKAKDDKRISTRHR